LIVTTAAVTNIEPIYDAIILTRKAYDLDAAVAAITPALGQCRRNCPPPRGASPSYGLRLYRSPDLNAPRHIDQRAMIERVTTRISPGRPRPVSNTTRKYCGILPQVRRTARITGMELLRSIAR
jgi:hypothetical protein